MKSLLFLLIMTFIVAAGVQADEFERDTVKTSAGDLVMTFLGHGTLMFEFNGRIIHIDPYSRVADFTELPDADLIVITHEHRDHLDEEALKEVRTEKTQIVAPPNCVEQLGAGMAMTNGETKTVMNIKIEAVPAYNIEHKRENGQPFHPKGVGNGYILTFSDKRIYVAGDTENTPEMKALENIDIAFLPMNLPYTMTPEMVADAAKAFQPDILYPYHYGDTDPRILYDVLEGQKQIEIRIRDLR